MRIEYIRLKYFKRFKLANIKDFEATFPEAITVIIAESGKGKSSLLTQLNPFPAVRTDFEKDGYKEIRISHEGHSYQLISDFSNRNNPHSFIVDGVEQNLGHTTDVQNDLVKKHFNLSNLIYNLVYNKIKLTDITYSARRDLFITLNPIDLSLVMDTHHKAVSKLKDCKANIQMLQTRKVELEGKLLSEEILAQHKTTYDKLRAAKNVAERYIYAIDQHLSHIEKEFSSALTYYNTHKDNVPADTIIAFCKRVRPKLIDFITVVKGESHLQARENLHAELKEYNTKLEYIRRDIQELTKQINEYRQHLDSTANNPISELEKQCTELTEALKAFKNLPDNPLPQSRIAIAETHLDDLTTPLLTILESGVKLDSSAKVRAAHEKLQELRYKQSALDSTIANATENIDKIKAGINTDNDTANIPHDCPGCGLLTVFTNNREAKLKDLTTQINLVESSNKALEKLKPEIDKLLEYLTPYHEYKLLTNLSTILNWIHTYLNWGWDENKLIDYLNEFNIALRDEIGVFLSGSNEYYRYKELKDKYDRLVVELQTTINSTKLSSEFVTHELQAKETALDVSLAELKLTREELERINKLSQVYQDYDATVDELTQIQKEYKLWYESELAYQANRYWWNTRVTLSEIMRQLDDELLDLDQIIRDQDRLRHTYNNEILVQLEKVTQDREVYEKLEHALSPTQGIPYKHMLQFLNALISNANYLLGKVWSYPLILKTLETGTKLDYTLPVRVGSEQNKDINQLSDGQSEIMNLVWVITILLQLKLLNKMPFYADEITRCMDNHHRVRTIELLNSLLDNKLIEQCFIINHFVSVSEGFRNSNIICLSTENLTDVPENANANVTIVPY